MIISFFFISILLISLYGISFILKYAFVDNASNLKIYNIDIVYGIILLVTILMLANFFFPIKYSVFPIFFIGFFLFIYGLKKKILHLKYTFYNIIGLLILVYISSNNGPIYDTQLYHHQILNWSYDYKIVFNLVSLEERYGMISPWYLLLSIGNFKVNDAYLANLINYIPFFILISEFISEKRGKLTYPKLYLIFANIYIFFFSLIHPFQNGTILMNLGSLGSDTAGSIFFILTIYFFLKCNENLKIEFYNLTLIFSILSIFCKISNLPLLFLVLALIYQSKFIFLKLKINLFIIFLFLIWFVRNFIISGCLIFPVSFSCLDLDMFISKSNIETYSNIVKSFARTAPTYENFMNLEFSINSNKWFLPWVNNYFVKSSITQIMSLLSFIFIIPFMKALMQQKKNFYVKIILIFSLATSLILWLQAPDIRFAVGLLISIPIILVIFSFRIEFLEKFNFIIKNFLILIFVCLIFKNFQNYKYFFEKSLFQRDYKIDSIKKIDSIENFDISQNKNDGGFCFDIEPICLIQDKKIQVSYNKLKYLHFTSN